MRQCIYDALNVFFYTPATANNATGSAISEEVLINEDFVLCREPSGHGGQKGN